MIITKISMIVVVIVAVIFMVVPGGPFRDTISGRARKLKLLKLGIILNAMFFAVVIYAEFTLWQLLIN